LPAFSRSAAYYDSICAARQRDYDREVGRLAKIVEAFANGSPRPPPWVERLVVDWGCGTGEHVSRWPRHGWQAVGVEPCPEMVAIAQTKGLDVRRGSLREACSGYPSIVPMSHIHTCLFAAFSYATVDGIDKCLKSISYNCSRPGWFIFDVVNHSAAACHLRTPDVLEAPEVVRTMRKSFNLLDSLLTYEIEYAPRDDSESFIERHVLRAFTPREITDALDRNGFDVLAIFDPESPERATPRPDSFYFMCVARKR
jgi:SAM-dependent methyltransferase